MVKQEKSCFFSLAGTFCWVDRNVSAFYCDRWEIIFGRPAKELVLLGNALKEGIRITVKLSGAA